MPVDYDLLIPYAERYATLSHAPLRVTLELATPIGGYELPYLDGLLAAAVVREATDGAGIPPSGEPYHLPVPLACLWRSEAGLPLWAATRLEPVGDDDADVHYWHKRAPRPEWAQKNKQGVWPVRVNNGRYKEYRIPLPVHTATIWQADCLGNRAEIERLLPVLGSHIGKRRDMGLGAVRGWRVEPVERFSLTDDDGRLRRPVPWEYARVLTDVAYMGWTPPYWHPDTQTMCVPPDVAVPELAWTERATVATDDAPAFAAAFPARERVTFRVSGEGVTVVGGALTDEQIEYIVRANGILL